MFGFKDVYCKPATENNEQYATNNITISCVRSCVHFLKCINVIYKVLDGTIHILDVVPSAQEQYFQNF
jgi:hypothetical protein